MKQARNLKGLSQKEMAKRLNVGITTYQHYENLHDGRIRLGKALEFSKIVNIPMDDIIFFANKVHS